MDLLPPTAPSLVFARETCRPYYVVFVKHKYNMSVGEAYVISGPVCRQCALVYRKHRHREVVPVQPKQLLETARRREIIELACGKWFKCAFSEIMEWMFAADRTTY